MQPQMYTVALISKREVAWKTTEFVFACPHGFVFEPGQHVEIILVDLPEADESGNKRDFSLVSAPHEKDLVVVARIRDSTFKKGLNALTLGQEVSLRGPLGSLFRLHVDTTRPAVFLAGGIGIAPFISMARHVFHDMLPYEIYLFYSNRRPEDTVYHTELAELAATHSQFRYIPTMTNMKQSTEVWQGAEGRISKEMIAKYVDRIDTPVFYIAGPPAMVIGIDQLLHDMGVSRDFVRTEEFTGY